MGRAASDLTEKDPRRLQHTKTVMFHVKQFLIHNSEF